MNTSISSLPSRPSRMCCVVLFAGTALLPGLFRCEALPIHTDRATWEAAAAASNPVSLPFSNAEAVPAGSAVDLPSGKTLTFDQALVAYEVGAPSGWSTWSGGLSGFTVLAATTSDPLAAVTVRGDFSAPVQAFGFEVQPADFETWTITLGLADGTTAATQELSGFGGAGFFGWISPDPSQLAWFEITSEPGALGFAISRMVEGTVSGVPVTDMDDASLLLLLGLGAVLGVSRLRPCVSR